MSCQKATDEGEENICECRGPLECNKTMDAVAWFFFFVAAGCCCCGVRSCFRHTYLTQILDEEEAERYIEEKLDISHRVGTATVAASFCCCCCCFVAAGVLILHYRRGYE